MKLHIHNSVSLIVFNHGRLGILEIALALVDGNFSFSSVLCSLPKQLTSQNISGSNSECRSPTSRFFSPIFATQEQNAAGPDLSLVEVLDGCSF